MAERKRDWARLKYAVVRARVEAGFETRKQFADFITEKYGYISTRTLLQLENGRAVNVNTLTVVELALGWPPGTCEAILNGGDAPKLSPTPSTDSDPADDADTELRETLRVLRRAMGREPVLRWVDELSRESKDPNSESDQSG